MLVRLQPQGAGLARARPADAASSAREQQHGGATETMSRGIQSRRVDREDIPRGLARPLSRKRPRPSTRRGSSATPRLIGLPLRVTIPKIDGIPWRYCTRWDEQPAATLAKSLLRQGICRLEDWSGSAVDFVRSELDFWSRLDDVKRLSQQLVHAPEVRVVEIPQATHYVLLDRPERGRSRLLQEIVSFLAMKDTAEK
jgi:pimeloyl-ACP methyl ester carboxylesterase